MGGFQASIVAATAILAASNVHVIAQEQVGQATLVRTSVTGQGGELATRSPVYADERIATSQSGLGEFRFADGTKFAVGGGSSVVIDKFVYDSSKTFDKLSLNAARGSFRWISGKSKSEAYEIATPSGTIGIRGTRLDIYVAPNGLTSVILLSGRAQFCGANGCRDLTRRCDAIIATPGGAVETTRANREILNTVGSDQAFPFLTGRQRLSRGFNSVFGGSCGLASASNPGPRGERGDGNRPSPRSGGDRGDDGESPGEGPGEGPNY